MYALPSVLAGCAGVARPKRALEVDDPECREIAEQLLREARKIPT